MKLKLPKIFTAYWLFDKLHYGYGSKYVLDMLITRNLIKVIEYKPLIRNNGSVTDTVYECLSEFRISVSSYLSVYHLK